MFISLVSSTRLLFTLRKGNVGMLKELRNLVNDILHTLVLYMKSSLAVIALGFFKRLMHVFLGTRGSF